MEEVNLRALWRIWMKEGRGEYFQNEGSCEKKTLKMAVSTVYSLPCYPATLVKNTPRVADNTEGRLGSSVKTKGL